MAPAQRERMSKKDLGNLHKGEINELHGLMDPTLEKFFDIGNRNFFPNKKPV